MKSWHDRSAEPGELNGVWRTSVATLMRREGYFAPQRASQSVSRRALKPPEPADKQPYHFRAAEDRRSVCSQPLEGQASLRDAGPGGRGALQTGSSTYGELHHVQHLFICSALVSAQTQHFVNTPVQFKTHSSPRASAPAFQHLSISFSCLLAFILQTQH